MKKIRHSKLPITIISGDNLDIDMLEAIQLNLMYDEKKSKRENLRGWELWVDEYGEWFNGIIDNVSLWNYALSQSEIYSIIFLLLKITSVIFI